MLSINCYFETFWLLNYSLTWCCYFCTWFCLCHSSYCLIYLYSWKVNVWKQWQFRKDLQIINSWKIKHFPWQFKKKWGFGCMRNIMCMRIPTNLFSIMIWYSVHQFNSTMDKSQTFQYIDKWFINYRNYMIEYRIAKIVTSLIQYYP